MLQQEYEYLLQRTEESRYDLYETVTSGWKIAVAKVIDWLFVALGMATVLILTLNYSQTWEGLAVILVATFVLFYELIKILLKGISFGYLITGIRFVNIKTKKPVTSKEYSEYLLQNLNIDFKRNLVKYYFNYNNRLNQNLPMKKFGFVLVDVPKYNSFVKEYKHNLERLQVVKKQLSL